MARTSGSESPSTPPTRPDDHEDMEVLMMADEEFGKDEWSEVEQSEEKEEFGKEEWSEVEQTEEDEQQSKEDEERRKERSKEEEQEEQSGEIEEEHGRA